MGATSPAPRPAPPEEEPRFAWSGTLCGYLGLGRQPAGRPPCIRTDTRSELACDAFLRCFAAVRAPGTMRSDFRIIVFELVWSYGDSNPRPLPCHTAATRPQQYICAGHRLRTSARVPRNPGRLLYFRAVRAPLEPRAEDPGLSTYEISARLAAEGTPLNRTGVGEVLAEEGFGRLIRHPEPAESVSAATPGRDTRLPRASVIAFGAWLARLEANCGSCSAHRPALWPCGRVASELARIPG